MALRSPSFHSQRAHASARTVARARLRLRTFTTQATVRWVGSEEGKGRVVGAGEATGLSNKFFSEHCKLFKTPRLLDETHVVLDIRAARAFDAERIVKPPKRTFNAPWPAAEGDEGAWGALAASRLGRPLTRGVLVMSASGGRDAELAAEALQSAGYLDVNAVEGGWAAWRKLWTTSGRPAPPPGRWVSTGKEALKSGLNVGAAATAYEELQNVEDATKI